MSERPAWAVELERVMTACGWTQVELARRAGVSTGALGKWMTGNVVPSLALAVDVAETVGSTRFLALVKQARSNVCVVCKRRFYTQRSLDADYCSARCRGSRRNRDWEKRRDEERRRFAGRRLAVYQDAVYRKCMFHCEHDGACPDATCSIQEAGLSPLPLARDAMTAA